MNELLEYTTEIVDGIPMRFVRLRPSAAQRSEERAPDEIFGVPLTGEQKSEWLAGGEARRRVVTLIQMTPQAVRYKLRAIFAHVTRDTAPLAVGLLDDRREERQEVSRMLGDGRHMSTLELLAQLRFALDMDHAAALGRLLDEAARRGVTLYKYAHTDDRNLVVDALVRRQRDCLAELCKARRTADGDSVVTLAAPRISHQNVLGALALGAGDNSEAWQMLAILWSGEILDEQERDDLMFGVHTRDALIYALRLPNNEELGDMLLDNYEYDCGLQQLISEADLRREVERTAD